MKLSRRIGRIKPSATLSINAKAKALKRSGVSIINFGVGEPDFDTPQNIRNAAMQSICSGQTRYTAVGGIDELKDAVCSTIKADYGLSYGRENVLISCGGKHALYNLFMTLLDPGDEVIIPSPYWVSYPDMVDLANAKPVIVPCTEKDGFILQAEDLEKAITPNTRLLILNSPSNPTGKYYGPDELEALAEVLLRHENVLIASDDIYYRILFGGRKWVNLGMVEEKLRDRHFYHKRRQQKLLHDRVANWLPHRRPDGYKGRNGFPEPGHQQSDLNITVGKRRGAHRRSASRLWKWRKSSKNGVNECWSAFPTCRT